MLNELKNQLVWVLAIALALAMIASTGDPLSTAQAGAAVGPSIWVAPKVSNGTCTFKDTEITTADSFDQTTSKNFVDLRDAGSLNFRQTRRGCVAGDFFANSGNGSEGDHVLLQVLLDGKPCAPLTGGYIFANSGTDGPGHLAKFFCGDGVVAGKHIIRVQYASGLGGEVDFFQRTLEVMHQ